jgi:hypothetical protein
MCGVPGFLYKDPGRTGPIGQTIEPAAERLTNLLNSMTMELQMVARACGKSNVHDLEPEDLRALTLEASIMSGCPLVGTEINMRTVFNNLATLSAQLAAAGANGVQA